MKVSGRPITTDQRLPRYSFVKSTKLLLTCASSEGVRDAMEAWLALRLSRPGAGDGGRPPVDVVADEGSSDVI